MLVFVFIFVESGAKEELSMPAEAYELPTGYIPFSRFLFKGAFPQSHFEDKY